MEGWERLTHDDWSIVRLESSTVAGHTCKLIVLEPSACSGRWVELLRAQIAARVGREPRLRQRLLSTPLGLAAPVWVDDPDFDVANHVVPLQADQTVAVCGLAALAATVMTTRLDRSRPLWSIHVVDPLANGGAAVIWRIHHCMADGLTALRFFREVLWDGPAHANPVAPAATWSPHPLPGRGKLLAGGIAARLSTALEARRHWLLGHSSDRFAAMRAAVRRELVPGSGPSPFDAPKLSPERSVALHSVPLEEAKQVGRQLGDGATVNDVLLALVAGGLRYWLTLRGWVPATLRAKVPASLHEGDLLGNRDSFFVVDLPLGEPDPARRLRLIHEETTVRKAEHDARTLDHLFHDRATVSRPLQWLLSKRAKDPRVAALCVSNVPGPSSPVSIAGVRVEELFTLAEIGKRHALRVSAVSLDGVLSLGFCAEPSTVPDLDLIVEGVERERNALRTAAAQRR